MKKNLLRRVATNAMLGAAIISLTFSLDVGKGAFGMTSIPFMKFSPYLISCGSLFLYILSENQKKQLLFKPLVTVLIIFSVLFVIGPMNAVFNDARNIEETLLSRSLGVVVFFASLFIVKNRIEFDYFIKKFAVIVILFSLIMSLIIILFRAGLIFKDLTQIYHIEIFLPLSAIIAVVYFMKSNNIKYFALLTLLSSGFLSGKTTGYLLTIFVLLLLFYSFILKFFNKIKLKHTQNYVFIKIGFPLVSILLVMVGLIFVESFLAERLANSDESKLRRYMYEFRYNQFIESPWTGDMFSISPLVEYGWLKVPSHSDIMDLLAAGGWVTVLLFFLPVIFVLLKYFLTMKNTDKRILFLIAINVSVIITMAVNPLLFEPRLAYFFWMSLGILAAGDPNKFRVTN